MSDLTRFVNSQGYEFLIPAKYQYIETLGNHKFSSKAKCLDTSTNRVVVVEKYMNLGNELFALKEKIIDLHLQLQFNHPSVLKLYEVYIPNPRSSFRDFYTVSEFMETNLQSVLRSSQTLTEDHVKYFVYSLLLSINYLHSQGLMHLNLKPFTIGLNSDCTLKLLTGPEPWCIKKDLDKLNHSFSDNMQRPSIFYTAPEIYIGKNCGQAADIWSIGCIMAEIISKNVLFPASNCRDLMMKIFTILGIPSDDDLIETGIAENELRSIKIKERNSLRQIFPTIDPRAVDLIEKMIVFNPKKRPSASECLRHSYFEELFDESDLATAFHVSISEIDAIHQMEKPDLMNKLYDLSKNL